ncbi:MAG: 3-phosphoserine/phosphohydroxythreonine transaminase, partial [Spirochaetales bacterium]|nr:3-phosphoserine/phosphohydroxythreonine transaminase [Spirochaetales bacterium]
MERKKNFFAGPSVLPLEVLKQVQEELVDYQGNGLSMMETSHRGGMFEEMYDETIALFKDLIGAGEEYEFYFLGGGATLQFSMIPINFLPPGGTAGYINSGSWSEKALKDARKLGQVEVVWDGKESNYTTLPKMETLAIDPKLSYLYLCSNETIGGIEYKEFPASGPVPLVADMSSDILSRPFDINRFGMVFGGVQKNLGPAGATFVLYKKELLTRQNPDLPSYLDYAHHGKNGGLANTPPVFAIWVVNLVLKWIGRHGGVAGMARRAEEKSGLIYEVIDSSSFYRSPVDRNYRSAMNVVFRLPDEKLEELFIKESKREGMLGLKGHRSVGGLRASLYNSLEPAA